MMALGVALAVLIRPKVYVSRHASVAPVRRRCCECWCTDRFRSDSQFGVQRLRVIASWVKLFISVLLPWWVVVVLGKRTWVSIGASFKQLICL